MNKPQLIYSVFLITVIAGAAANETPETIQIQNYMARIFSDGSGAFGKLGTEKDIWKINISIDPITDEKQIAAQRYPYLYSERFGVIKAQSDIWLLLDLSNPKTELLCIAGHDFPGETAIIRIDTGEPITTAVDGCVELSEALDKTLSAADTITLRGRHWPHAHETESVSLDGYTALVSFLRSRR